MGFQETKRATEVTLVIRLSDYAFKPVSRDSMVSL